MRKGSINLKPTKYSEKIPKDHKCKNCDKGKGEVNFTVNKYKNYYHVRAYCNICKHLEVIDKRKKDLSKRIYPKG